MKIQSGQANNFIDAFIYFAANKGKIDTLGLEFTPVRCDIPTLNDHASRGDFEVTTASAHSYCLFKDKYDISPSGGFFSAAAIVSREKIDPKAVKDMKVAVGGTTTSAYVAGHLLFPEIRLMVLPHDKLVSAVSAGIVDCAVLASHDLLEAPVQGLSVVCDLGEWFKRTYNDLPLPITVTVIKSSLDHEIKSKIVSVIRDSVRYALANRPEALDYAMQFAANRDRLKIGQFIGDYITDISADMQNTGKQALETFFQQAHKIGLIEKTETKFVI